MYQIPWIYLDQSKEQTLPAKNQQKTQKTFAQTLSNIYHIPISQLPQPCVKEDELTITILEDEYQAGLEACKHNLRGCII